MLYFTISFMLNVHSNYIHFFKFFLPVKIYMLIISNNYYYFALCIFFFILYNFFFICILVIIVIQFYKKNQKQEEKKKYLNKKFGKFIEFFCLLFFSFS